MSTSPYPQVEVAVVLIEREHRYLAEYNPRWQAFTLPMAKLRAGEQRRDAAVRAAAKAIGQPLPPTNLPRYASLEVPPHLLCRSGSDGTTKHYSYALFVLPVDDPAPRHALGWHTIWLSREAFLTHQPVSPTALFVFQHIDEDEL